MHQKWLRVPCGESEELPTCRYQPSLGFEEQGFNRQAPREQQSPTPLRMNTAGATIYDALPQGALRVCPIPSGTASVGRFNEPCAPGSVLESPFACVLLFQSLDAPVHVGGSASAESSCRRSAGEFSPTTYPRSPRTLPPDPYRSPECGWCESQQRRTAGRYAAVN